ncbi:hypothetical protein FRC11_000561, partial [Ceratobasidium sp. 423]
SFGRVIACLVQHGCRDVTAELELNGSNWHPFTGGGYGMIYQGALAGGLVVAIKCAKVCGHWSACKPAETSLKRAARELYVWSKCDHPGILKVLGFAQIEGHLILVSPWMKNGTLMNHIALHPWINRLQLVVELAIAIEHLHSQSIVHGDIKSDNVVVSDDGHVQLTDFGSAMFLQARTLCFTQTTHTKGTLRFMFSPKGKAPEILSGASNQCSTQVDIYATGMLMAGFMPQQITSGESPYADKNDFQVWAAVVNEKLLPTRPDFCRCLGIQSEDVSNALWGLLRHCWNPNPDERPTAAEIEGV